MIVSGIFIVFYLYIRFEPPGMISAGMSCYLYVTFEPKVKKLVLVLFGIFC
jgi:hypothetical protein